MATNPGVPARAYAAAVVAAGLISACGENRSGPPTSTAALCALTGEAARGAAWAPTCRGCHEIAVGQTAQPSKGPDLHDIYDSPAGTISLKRGYRYAAPMQAARRAGLIWTADNLDEYLKNPRAFLERFTGQQFAPTAPIMNFFVGGDGSEQERTRRDIVAYLKAIKDQPCS